ncbi:hypothetical protein [Pararobbsia alpina]|uniref:hypothetical protein n=1 Tax=Pararobbsia alpina TaxID=621374 RepID=UPI00158401C6|nr:hypothetical protein [Pararobbsia alpina]
MSTSSGAPAGGNYVPFPPKVASGPPPQQSSFLVEHLGVISAVVTIGVALISAIVFFNNMGRDIGDIKSDVKDGNNKLSELSEKTERNSSELQGVTGVIQNMQGEMRGLQIYAPANKR